MKKTDDLTTPIDWPHDGWTHTFVLGEAEAAEIAVKLDLSAHPADMQLAVDFDLAAAGKELVVKLHLTGRVTQTCVVTLDPIETRIEETFLRRFRDQAFVDQTEVDIAALDVDIATLNEDLEPWPRSMDERPSLLDFAIEQLGLVLEPFPRKDGAEVDSHLLTDPTDRLEKMSPFAALASLKTAPEGD